MESATSPSTPLLQEELEEKAVDMTSEYIALKSQRQTQWRFSMRYVIMLALFVFTFISILIFRDEIYFQNYFANNLCRNFSFTHFEGSSNTGGEATEAWHPDINFLSSMPAIEFKWAFNHPLKLFYPDNYPRDPKTTCRIPQFHPLSNDFVRLNGAPKPFPCRDKRTRIFHINYHNRSLHLADDVDNCFLQEVMRVTDDKINYTDMVPVHNKITRVKLSRPNIQFIRLSCDREKEQVQQYHLVDPKWYHDKNEATNHASTTQQSILVFVLESMSRMAFMRYMPYTYMYLRRNLSAHILQLHHKTGDNSFPNVYTILAGTNKTNATSFDKEPLLFYKFNNSGYTTFYSEDNSIWNSFNYLLDGFINQPTDYYLRLFWKITEETSDDKHCYFNATRYDINLEYLEYLINKPKAKPLFAFNFYVNRTHNRESYAGGLDSPTVKFLDKISEKVLSGELLLFVLGDHGHRYSPLMETFEGFVETKLPFGAVATSGKKLNELLDINMKRLTSQLDIHETLSCIIGECAKGKGDLLPRGVNLLGSEIPVNRSCREAGVHDVYCACTGSHTTSNHTESPQSIAKMAVGFINGMLRNDTTASQKCKTLQLDRVDDSFSYASSVVVVFRTTPGSALFQLTFSDKHIDESQLSRINAYGEPCINDVILRKYCYCE